MDEVATEPMEPRGISEGRHEKSKAKLAGMDQRKDRSWTPTLSTSSS